MDDRTLDGLFLRFRDRGDGAALAAVFDAAAPALAEVARHLTRDPAEAEDLVQGTFLAAIQGARRYDGSAPVHAWLYGILWREAARARRRAARGAAADVATAGLTREGEAEPLDGLARAEVPAAVERALGRIPARYREVLEPHLREGRRPEEIARALARPPGTVRSQLSRGLARLRRALPAGLAPASAALALPPGTLARVRGEVLRAAGAPLGAARPAAAPAWLGAAKGAAALLAGAAAVGLVAAAVRAWGAPGGRHAAASVARPEGTSVAARPDAEAAGTEGAAEAADRAAAPARAAARAAEGGGAGARAEEAAPADAASEALAYWRARYAEAPDDWRHGWSVTEALAGALEPDEALRVLAALWPELSDPVKGQALKPFVFGGLHPRALDVLDLAATDPSLEVQGRAFTYLRGFAFRDFAADYPAYLAWRDAWRGVPLERVIAESARAFAAELGALAPAAAARRMAEVGRIDVDAGARAGVDVAAAMREAGALRSLEPLVLGEDRDAAVRALGWARDLRADEPWLRAFALPLVQAFEETDPAVLEAASRALGRADCGFAGPELVRVVERVAAADPGSERARGAAAAAAAALAEIGDPAAIPALIRALQRAPDGRLDDAIGACGLARLTGVRWERGAGAAFWLEWWDKNAGRLPPHVAAQSARL